MGVKVLQEPEGDSRTFKALRLSFFFFGSRNFIVSLKAEARPGGEGDPTFEQALPHFLGLVA